jgi:uncharacterized protein YjbI with pentapeptide repeats
LTDLPGAEDTYDEHQFRDLLLDGSEIVSVAFRDCLFIGCSFGEAALRACRFSGCTFEGCDLSLAQVSASSFSNVRFERSKLIGINWTEADWPMGQPLFPPVSFFDCAISYSTFAGLGLAGASLVRCVAREADFTETDLSGADCRETDFADSRFIATNLTDADFSGATGYIISPTLNTLRRTKFSFPEAIALLRALDIVLTE